VALSSELKHRLKLPLIAAPMLRVSGPEIVISACRNGVIGAFPTANAGSPEQLDTWLTQITRSLQESGKPFAPWCPNIIVHRDPEILRKEVSCVIKHGAEMVITSVGSPLPVIAPLHDAGCSVFADVASLHHAKKALEAGADGLILLTGGAGGQTGWANGFAFVRAVRSFFDGPLVLAGGVSDGCALWAAQTLGCDLGYMGTKFIATKESLASSTYKDMLIASELDDVVTTRAFSGLNANMLTKSIMAAGLDPKTLDEHITTERAREIFGARKGNADKPVRWKDIWSAGHSVSGVNSVTSVAELIEITKREYEAAIKHSQELASSWA
jgi:nitronate monooxygenase